MFGKPPITVVQEYCAKNHLEAPVYEAMDDINDGEGRMFVAQIAALGVTCQGVGRSKKDAKHDAAKNLITKMRTSHPGLDEIPQAEVVSVAAPSSDAVRLLRDMCVQRDCPLPQFELIQQAGPPESPQYTFQCSVAQIVRMSTAITKKMAKQLAAQQMIDIIQSIKLNQTNEENLQVTSLDTAAEEIEEENYRKFKSYRELTESDVKLTYVGKKFSDRYQYFRNFYDELKREAHQVLHSDDYLSQQDKVLDLLRVLKLKHRVSTMNMLNMETFVVFEVICDIDVVFINSRSAIYDEILQYFQGMLAE